MAHRTTQSIVDKPSSCLRLKLTAKLSALGTRVFASTDIEARRHGWQVIATNGGLGRRYRHPGLDKIGTCRCQALPATPAPRGLG
jgi:hypothetical protein